MITDELTNKVYFSEYLKDYKCWKNIKEALHEHEISIRNTVWYKGYMGKRFHAYSKGCEIFHRL